MFLQLCSLNDAQDVPQGCCTICLASLKDCFIGCSHVRQGLNDGESLRFRFVLNCELHIYSEDKNLSRHFTEEGAVLGSGVGCWEKDLTDQEITARSAFM